MVCFPCLPPFRVVSGRELSQARQCIGEHYVVKKLAHGSFGDVSVGEHVSTQRQVAMKCIERGRMSEEDIQREISIHRRIQHSNVVAVHDVIQSTWSSCIVMELALGGDLVEYLAKNGRMQEDRALHLFQQLVAAVGYCHSLAVAHRDLKLDNLLLADNFTLKLADFGLAREMIDGDVYASPAGSPSYVAPELLGCDLTKYKGAPADVYSCGVVLFCCLTNTFPFQSKCTEILYSLKQGGCYDVPGFVSVAAHNFLREVMLVSPVKRIMLQDMQKKSWFKRKIRVYRNISHSREDNGANEGSAAIKCDR